MKIAALKALIADLPDDADLVMAYPDTEGLSFGVARARAQPLYRAGPEEYWLEGFDGDADLDPALVLEMVRDEERPTKEERS